MGSIAGIRAKKNTTSIRQALTELQSGLRQLYGVKAPVLLVYGSYARQEIRPDSDLDVLLIYPHEIYPGQEIRRVSALLAELNLRHQVLISVMPTSQDRYQRSQGAFWENVRREGKPIQSV